jgi:hypothetical protein
MNYQVSRGGQTYGPYTSEDLQRYVASGNILPTDLAKSEAMSDWIPVSQILSGQQSFTSSVPDASGLSPSVFSGGAAPVYGGPVYQQTGAATSALSNSTYPDPPNLHWLLVLVISLVTCGLFMPIWNIIVAVWLKKVQPNAISLYLYIGAVVLALIQGVLIVPVVLAQIGHSSGDTSTVAGVGSAIANLIGLLAWVVRLVARYSQRSALIEHFGVNGPEPIGLDVNPVMTFFFGGLYFQSLLTPIAEQKKAARAAGGMYQPR